MKDWAVAHASSLGLNPARIDVKSIWNPGGLTNQSYRVSDGNTTRHMKLAPPRKADRLKRWASVSSELAERYHAPRLIAEIKDEIIPGYTYGLVFEFIKAKPLSEAADPGPVALQVLELLQQLQQDERIREILAEEAAAPSYADAFNEEYMERLTEDMEGIRTAKESLDFVTEQDLDGFDREVEVLRQLASDSPAFQHIAKDVVHNDIHWDNILVEETGRFWIIDWDDLSAAGDAAMDYSVLLWTLHESAEWPKWQEQAMELAGMGTGGITDRLEFYFRAKLLDDVIDVLADYVEVDGVPEWMEKTRQRAKAIHLRSYPEYIRRYGSLAERP
ncbi:phosphotransferase family protein [Paenibacillus gorillae]|uniref:phosphotransferase family protein n=1 Tax=Paenibacillus gorillae TaxID=1243662 RepID=UPI0004B53DC7|nr:aminoglycoside phosphotransferase family protein [Paenibacillus gorillae]